MYNLRLRFAALSLLLVGCVAAQDESRFTKIELDTDEAGAIADMTEDSGTVVFSGGGHFTDYITIPGLVWDGVVTGISADYVLGGSAGTGPFVPTPINPLVPTGGTQAVTGAVSISGNAIISGGTTTLGGTQPTITTATSAFISAEPGASGSIATFDYQNVDGNTGSSALAGSGFALSYWYKGKRSGGSVPTHSKRVVFTMQPSINDGAATWLELVAGTGTARGFFITPAGSADINLGSASTHDTNMSGAAVIQGNMSFNGNGTFGNASGDSVTFNAATVAFNSDTAVSLVGGVNGINIDSNTVSIDAANNRVGVLTAAPSSTLHTVGDIRGEATRWKDIAASCYGNADWTFQSGGIGLTTATSGKLIYIPIPYEAGTTVSQIRVKWDGDGSDGVKFRIVKRDDSSTLSTIWTVEGSQQSPTTGSSVTVTTYNIADFALVANTSYAIEVESVVSGGGNCYVYSVGIETTFRIY